MINSICFSLVIYKHSLDFISPLLLSISSLARSLPASLISLSVYDGSPSSYRSPTKNEILPFIENVQLFYHHGPNIGFGRANNFNFQAAGISSTDIFIVANPDISFYAQDLIPLINFVSQSSSLACVSPLIKLPDGSIQRSVKQNPTVLSLLIGRFKILRLIWCLNKYDVWHRNLHLDYTTEVIESTYLSGCFLLIPAWAYKFVGGFSPKYFLHVEDADLVRRLSSIGLTLHNPLGSVCHGWARGSHSSPAQIYSLLKSFVIYSACWGFRLF